MPFYTINYTLPGRTADRRTFKDRSHVFTFIENLLLEGCTYITLKVEQ